MTQPEAGSEQIEAPTKLINNPLLRKILLVLAGWLLAVAALAAYFRNWAILELLIFPPAVFVWILRNEDRLQKTRADLTPLSQNARVHFFFTVPLLIAIRAVLSIAQAVKEPDRWRLILAMSFGIAWCLVLLYAFALVARKRKPTSSS